MSRYDDRAIVIRGTEVLIGEHVVVHAVNEDSARCIWATIALAYMRQVRYSANSANSA